MKESRQILVVLMLILGSYLVAGWLSREIVELIQSSDFSVSSFVRENSAIMNWALHAIFFIAALWLYFDEIKKCCGAYFSKK